MSYEISDSEVSEVVNQLIAIVNKYRDTPEVRQEVFNFIKPFIQHYNNIAYQLGRCAEEIHGK